MCFTNYLRRYYFIFAPCQAAYFKSIKFVFGSFGRDVSASPTVNSSMHGTPGIVFVPRDELEARSPSRPHGIDARLEAAFRWSYCEFLKDAGIELRMYVRSFL